MGQANSADLPDGLSELFLQARLDRLLGDLPGGLVCRSQVRELSLRLTRSSSQAAAAIKLLW
jgi:hypothetical protein